MNPAMTEPVLWIGGWASGLACWRAELAAIYPGREHRFLDAHSALDNPGSLEREVGRLPAGGCVAAWSLGSLLLHRALADGFSPACRSLSLSPIFAFCRADGPWPKAAIRRMERRLPAERAAVLGEFRTLAFGNTPVTQDMAAAWNAQAGGYPLATLERGLRALAETEVPPASVAGRGRHAFLASPRDPLSPSPAPPPDGWSAYPSGHLPFLEFPAQVAALLDGSSA